jgi:serine/threonine protein kinase
MSLRPGARLGPYEIVSHAGAGELGDVYRARDTRLDRTVAIKILPPSLAEYAAVRERFDRGARAVSQFTHPNICTLGEPQASLHTLNVVVDWFNELNARVPVT